MAGQIDARLEALNIELPPAPAPVANYAPYVVTGKLVFVAGQIAFADGELQYKGKVGRDLGLEEAQAAARICGLNVIAQVKAACGGDLDRVARCVKLGSYVSSTDDFTGQAQVLNGASDLMVEVFGERGKHARYAVGTNVLPLDASVEVDALFEID